jgi:lysophospholipase L1-like esterase
MFRRWFGLVSAIVVSLAVVSAGPAQTAPHPQWNGTWAASPMLADFGFSVHPFSATTLREIVHVSTGGSQVRVRFTNAYGRDQLIIRDAHVALSAGGAAIDPGTDRPLTFGGSASISIPPGAEIYSDPVSLDLPPLSNLAISFFLPSQVMGRETYHAFADQDNFIVDGDQASSASLAQPTVVDSWYFLDGVDVNAVAGSRSVVTLGDSITDGAHSTHNGNDRWPDVLAARLQDEPALAQIGVLNQGIGGNRVLNDQAGPNALARLDRDVLSQDGARYVIVLESINDIGRLHKLTAPEDKIDAKELEEGLRQIAETAQEHRMKVYGATLTPYQGANYYSEKGEQVREAVNNWIRSSGTFDGVIDFDKITRDPQNPQQFNPLYDSGDHLHPNDAGYKAMADGIDLALFK